MDCETFKILVLLPYRFTLFSNSGKVGQAIERFYYLIDLHYSQTICLKDFLTLRFYYLIDLHYSQTHELRKATTRLFYYLIDLHYSQTLYSGFPMFVPFYYLIDLHYSQTKYQHFVIIYIVLLPYRFTLFSNPWKYK